jgi:hypothetical protein
MNPRLSKCLTSPFQCPVSGAFQDRGGSSHSRSLSNVVDLVNVERNLRKVEIMTPAELL